MSSSSPILSQSAFAIETLGECVVSSPMSVAHFVEPGAHVLLHSTRDDIRWYLERGEEPPAFELAGPRKMIFFDPHGLRCGIVTCGGLCPGLNDVIRALVLSLHHHYGVQAIYGFRYGYEGLNPAYGHEPLMLTPQAVEHIGDLGGTILGTSRGPQEPAVMVNYLEQLGVNILFTIGGDGTLRGAQAVSQEAARRGLPLSVIGIPKTIDNDISFIQQSFGFVTAASEALTAIESAHVEAVGARNGVGLVKLMGRESGFVAAYTSLADSLVNFCLVPESPFDLNLFLEALRQRLELRGHAVIAVAEGAGQELIQAAGERDASGNVKFGDIGLFLRDQIRAHFKHLGVELNLKYIDPSYMIRSVPANAYDSAFCLMLAHNAAHAGLSGRTNMVVGSWRGEFTHVPISLATSARRKIDSHGWLWESVLSSTGQPRTMHA
jgi:6-phosphofructokinase 1